MRRNMFLKYSLNNRSQKCIRKVIETINNREKGEYISIFTTPVFSTPYQGLTLSYGCWVSPCHALWNPSTSPLIYHCVRSLRPNIAHTHHVYPLPTSFKALTLSLGIQHPIPAFFCYVRASPPTPSHIPLWWISTPSCTHTQVLQALMLGLAYFRIVSEVVEHWNIGYQMPVDLIVTL